jgi:hypothetical protein
MPLQRLRDLIGRRAGNLDVFSTLHAREVHYTPSPEALEYGPKSSAMSRQLISDPKAGLLCFRASDEAVGLKLSQLLPKHFGCYAIYSPPKFAKSERPAPQALENHRLPPTIYDVNRRV